MFFFVSPFRLNLLLHDGQIEESHQSQPDPQVAQEPNQEAIFQEAHQDERNGPQVLEEPEVCQEAQRQSYPTVEARSQERSRQINPFPVFCFAMRYRHLCAVVYLQQNKMIVK